MMSPINLRPRSEAKPSHQKIDAQSRMTWEWYKIIGCKKPFHAGIESCRQQFGRHPFIERWSNQFSSQPCVEGMPSKSFIKAKEQGRYFEELMVPVLIEMGFKVIDTDHWSYSQKKGVDKIVEINGARAGIEFKFDRMSEQTSNVCIDLDSINKTTSAIWIYGLPNGGRIDVYSMRISDLAPFARDYPIKRKVGEWGGECALIEKSVFISQPFINHWKTIKQGSDQR